MEKIYKNYMKENNEKLLAGTPIKLVSRRVYFWLKVFAITGMVAILIIAMSVVNASQNDQDIRNIIPIKIIIEHKVSNETLNIIKDYLNDTLLKLKG